MALDLLAFAAHRDDVEITCGGLLISMIERGYRVGACDLTRGELGTLGSAPERKSDIYRNYPIDPNRFKKPLN